MKIFIYVCVFLCLYSCSESKHISEELNRTEEIINDYPDSVLRSLQAIAPGSICKKSTKAHYGLLYSLALDKTGQTIDSDSMLRPAVNYFLRKGTNRQKFLSWYTTCIGVLGLRCARSDCGVRKRTGQVYEQRQVFASRERRIEPIAVQRTLAAPIEMADSRG